ncbi:hypothetical protein DPMN_113835 [Dreissena polymorpha]|uniref:Uncharacterized protein n=1 Tax=Dreissena polymorpha TaxID=45954 RepID=A0A9D4KJE5_DREPO|nr:hypothetical protein DPMN_113835 [Dreissena polymorpha]
MSFVQQYETTDAQTKVRRTRNYVRLVKNELETYTSQRKELNDPSKITPSSPLPSTSGLQINRPDVAMETDR